jgi:hypothetical protein
LSISQRSVAHHQIQIGIIGSEAVVENVVQVMNDFPSFSPEVRACFTEEEAASHARELATFVEMLLIVGPVLQR